MALERCIVNVPPDFFPPDHVRKGSRFSLDDRIGRIAEVQTTRGGTSLRLTIEVEV